MRYTNAMSICSSRTVRSRIAVVILAILVGASADRRCFAQSPEKRISPALFERTADLSLYALSNARLERNEKKETLLVFSFQVRQQRLLVAEHVVLRIGNEPSGYPLIQPLWAARNNEYRVRFDQDFTDRVRAQGAEIFVVGELSGSYVLLSNSITVGSARQQVSTRPMSRELLEMVARAVQREKDSGPKYDSVPEGFTALDKCRVVVKGMAARVFVDGQWKFAEYLGTDDKGQAVYRGDPSSREVAVTEKFSVLAYLESTTQETVGLIKVDGTALELPMSKLSERDQQVAAARMASDQ